MNALREKKCVCGRFVNSPLDETTLSEADIQAVAERTAALVLERLHPSVRNPPPEELGTYASPAPSPYQPRLDEDGAPLKSYPVSKGQIAAFNAKLGDLARLLRHDKADLKTAALKASSTTLGREIASTYDLTFDEMSDVLDLLEARIEKEKS